MLRPLLSTAGFAVMALAAGAAAAQCRTGCSSCCSLPTTHQVIVPGVTVTPPSITVGSPTLGCNTCGEGGGGGFGSINVVVNVNQSANAVAETSAGASAYSGAAANIILGGGGAGGGSTPGPPRRSAP